MNKVRIAAVLLVVAALAAAFWWAGPRGSATSVGPSPEKRGEAVVRSAIAFGVVPTIDDRFVSEPCSRIAGGGLSSVAAFMYEIEKDFPAAVGISMGDATQAWGGEGRSVASYLYNEIFPATKLGYVAAGEGELSLGVVYIRESLTRSGVTFLCANAADRDGQTLLRGWALLKAGDRVVLLVAVAAESLQAEISRRGSDVRLLSAAKAAAQARADGLKQAVREGLNVSVSALLVHGTVDEAAALVADMPGLTFAVAAHGGLLPDIEPRRVAGVPVFYGGRGARFAWRVLIPADRPVPASSLARLGAVFLSKGSPYDTALKTLSSEASSGGFERIAKEAGERPRDPAGRYVGAARCADCHILAAERHAASPHGAPSKELLEGPLAASTGCIPCHVTAPYSEGGWTGPKDRSDLASVSCEACHGPGEAHGAAPKSARMPRVPFSRCYECHLPDRSPGFDAQAAWKLVGHEGIK